LATKIEKDADFFATENKNEKKSEKQLLSVIFGNSNS
jgi:hypothetical protein